MKAMGWEFDTELWRSSSGQGDAPGDGSWHFASLPADASAEIRDLAGPRPGFGAVPVQVHLGASIWRTSLFPDSARGCYVLPVKKSVRVANDCEAGETVTVRVELVEQ